MINGRFGLRTAITALLATAAGMFHSDRPLTRAPKSYKSSSLFKPAKAKAHPFCGGSQECARRRRQIAAGIIHTN